MKIPEDKVLYPLSDAQKMLRWAENFSIEPSKVKENNILGFYVKLPEDFNRDANLGADALEKALNYVIKHNDSLRLRVVKTFHGLRQYISDYVYRTIERIPVNGEHGFDEFIQNISKYKVDWNDESLVFAKILMLSSTQCAMILRIHHSIIDGYSVRLLFEQLKDAYNQYIAGIEPEAPEKEYSITNFFKTIEKYHNSKQHSTDRKYWFNIYNKQRHYSFPAGYRSEKGACKTEEITIENDLYQRILTLAHDCNSSLQSYMMTMAALTTYVLTGKDNFCIYSLTHGRQNLIAKKTIGCMQNTVPTFFDISAEKPVSKIVSDSYMEFLEALSHGRFAMGEQVPLSYKEPIKHFFNFNHGWLLFSAMEYGQLFENSNDLRMGFLPQINIAHQFYFAMLEVPGDHITFDLSYQIRKFKQAQVVKMLHTFVEVCRLVVENPTVTPEQLKRTLNNK